MPHFNHKNGPLNRRFGREISDWFRDVFHFGGKKFGKATDYFEWLAHRLFASVGRVFTAVGLLFCPKQLIENARKSSARRRAERTDDLETRGVGKLIETLEYFFHRFATSVGSVFRSLYRLFVPAKLIESTEKAVAHKTADAYWDIRHRLKKLGERVAPKWLTNRVGRLYDALAAVFVFSSAWAVSRNYKKLLRAVPAILLAAPLFGSMAYSLVYSQADKVRHYQAALTAAINARDGENEQLCFAKLTQLGYQQTERAEYQAAYLLAQEEGKWDQALKRMKALAPVDRPGLPMAHIWIAANLAEGKIKEKNGWKLLETHARQALTQANARDRVLRDTARTFLVEVDLHHGRIDKALAEMEDLVDSFPSMHAELMDRYLVIDETAAARRHARYVDEFFSKIETRMGEEQSASEQEPIAAIAPQQYLRWARANELMGRPTKALDALERGNRQHPQNQLLRRALLDKHVPRLAVLALSDPQTVPLMKRVLEIEPTHQAVPLMLARGVLSNDEQVQACLDSLQAEKLLNADIMLMLGDTVSAQGDHRTAMKFYGEACKVDPSAARAWNNIAWILGNVEPRYLEEAIKAATKAIDSDPHPRYLETRGQLFIKLERWRDAIHDLELALNGRLPDTIAAHTSLAKAYSALGDTEQADAHRALVEAGDQPSS